MKKLIFCMAAICLVFAAQAQSNKKTKSKKTSVQQVVVPQPRRVEITTDLGVMVVELSDSTPLHRDNFIKLVQQGFYDSLLFHRVIQNFMIQGGDPNSKNAETGTMLGAGEAPGDRIPAEFRPYLFHKKGALAAARDNNPEKASSNCQFYIVQGQTYNDTTLNYMECNMRQENPLYRFSDAEREAYKTVGGTPFLDQNYTVFGQVVEGLDVLDKIAAVQKDENDRPVQDIHMKMRMLN